MDKHTLAASIRIGMFAERETIQEAFDYADQVFRSLAANDDIAARTAMHVVLNTVAKQIAALPDPLAAPAEEIRIETVQLSVDRATLDDIIDARINRWYENDFDIQEEINDAINEYDFEETVRDIVKHNITFSIYVD
jgi:hypothetical protein